MKDERPVANLRNLGPKSAMMLAEAGIRTVGELRAIGPVRAYARVKDLRKRGASLNLLWSMAAGLENRGWRDVSPEEKASLIAAYRRLLR
jgi:DNA transformation protein